MTLQQYLPYAFLGMRGSVRKRIHLEMGGNNHLNMGFLSKTNVTLGAIATYASSSWQWTNVDCVCDLRGTVSFVPSTNGGIEAELPYFSNNMFAFAFCDDYVGSGDTVNDMVEMWSQTYVVNFECDYVISTDNLVVVESAMGEDFNYFRFCGAPLYSVVSED